MTTSKNIDTAKSLIGTEINELEYIDHMVIEGGKTYFSVIHLNGNERLVPVEDIMS